MKAKIIIVLIAAFRISQCIALESDPNENYDKEHIRSGFEYFPFVLYDTDIGLGAGIKFFLLDQFDKAESFDLLLFASTKGERWGRFVFSIPDFEIRHKEDFGWSFDFTFDYDLMIKYNYFGIGPSSDYADREYYSYEPLDMHLVISRSITEELVLYSGIRYFSARNYGFERNSRLLSQQLKLNSGKAISISYFIKASWDTRNNYLHPSCGHLLETHIEHCPDIAFSNVNYLKFGFSINKFVNLSIIKSILAFRLLAENINGQDLPVQMMIPIGGNRTLRGYPQARFIDHFAVVTNTELRFPIWWKFGAVIGLDAGKVSRDMKYLTINDWAIAQAFGIRFYYNNFIIRFDTGLSDETFCLYFNINHIF